MKAFYNMSVDEQRTERLRRVAIMLKAIRGLSKKEAFGLFAAALALDGERSSAALALKYTEGL